MQEASDMPHTSAIGIPSASMNFRTSGAIGAAPDTAILSWSRPTADRIFDSTCSSAR